LHVARFSPDGKLIVTASADGTARVWETASRNAVATLKKHEGAVLNARFSFDGKLLVTAGADGAIVAWDTATWRQTGATMVMPGEVWSAVIGPDNEFVLAASLLSRGVRIFEIATGRPFTDGIEMPTDAVSVDINPSGEVVAIASVDGAVRTYGSPFVQEDVPRWMPDFAEQIIGMRVVRAGKFALVKSEYQHLKNYVGVGAHGSTADFPRLARWLVSRGVERTGMPRTFATIYGT
jgi:WD40 repeat protein